MAKKILSIDDDQVFGLVVEKMFENNNNLHRVVTKTSIIDGLNYLKEISLYEYPDIILVDVNMPKGGAFTFLQQYENLGLELKNADLYFISSNIFPEDQRTVLQSKIVKGIFQKPFDHDQVAQMIN
jgi:CheY-like chemotaxis protein